jgi:hypothetical protein
VNQVYLKKYPIGPDEEDRAWAEGIDIDLVRDPPIDVTPEKDVASESDTGNGEDPDGVGTV